MKPTKNPVTGDPIQSRPQSDAYAAGWERIFGNKIGKAAEPVLATPIATHPSEGRGGAVDKP
jgi:hypothetical protein